MLDFRNFFELNLMAYSLIVVDIFDVVNRKVHNTLLFFLGGDLNVNLQSTEAADFIIFTQKIFSLELNNDPTMSVSINLYIPLPMYQIQSPSLYSNANKKSAECLSVPFLR